MMDIFNKKKNDFLAKKDKSKKKSIDKGIKKLVDKINSSDNYFTTSSCSGRILLLVRKSEKKHETEWLFLKHSAVKFNEIKKALKKLPKYDAWLKQEAAIFHICCRTIEDAQQLVNTARNLGFRRSGIQATRRKIVAEIIGTDQMDTIIARNGKLIVGDGYLTILIEEANKKLGRNKEKVEMLYKEIG